MFFDKYRGLIIRHIQRGKKRRKSVDFFDKKTHFSISQFGIEITPNSPVILSLSKDLILSCLLINYPLCRDPSTSVGMTKRVVG